MISDYTASLRASLGGIGASAGAARSLKFVHQATAGAVETEGTKDEDSSCASGSAPDRDADCPQEGDPGAPGAKTIATIAAGAPAHNSTTRRGGQLHTAAPENDVLSPAELESSDRRPLLTKQLVEKILRERNGFAHHTEFNTELVLSNFKLRGFAPGVFSLLGAEDERDEQQTSSLWWSGYFGGNEATSTSGVAEIGGRDNESSGIHPASSRAGAGGWSLWTNANKDEQNQDQHRFYYGLFAETKQDASFYFLSSPLQLETLFLDNCGLRTLKTFDSALGGRKKARNEQDAAGGVCSGRGGGAASGSMARDGRVLDKKTTSRVVLETEHVENRRGTSTDAREPPPQSQEHDDDRRLSTNEVLAQATNSFSAPPVDDFEPQKNYVLGLLEEEGTPIQVPEVDEDQLRAGVFEKNVDNEEEAPAASQQPKIRSPGAGKMPGEIALPVDEDGKESQQIDVAEGEDPRASTSRPDGNPTGGTKASPTHNPVDDPESDTALRLPAATTGGAVLDAAKSTLSSFFTSMTAGVLSVTKEGPGPTPSSSHASLRPEPPGALLPLRNLQQLYLMKNELSGVFSSGDLPQNLVVLDISDNRITHLDFNSTATHAHQQQLPKLKQLNASRNLLGRGRRGGRRGVLSADVHVDEERPDEASTPVFVSVGDVDERDRPAPAQSNTTASTTSPCFTLFPSIAALRHLTALTILDVSDNDWFVGLEDEVDQRQHRSPDEDDESRTPAPGESTFDARTNQNDETLQALGDFFSEVYVNDENATTIEELARRLVFQNLRSLKIVTSARTTNASSNFKSDLDLISPERHRHYRETVALQLDSLIVLDDTNVRRS